MSVIVPARNAEATLTQALESLLAQTHTKWEALVVDDGSTDGTGALLSDFVTRDSRITVLSGPAKGVSAARNVGLAAARGRWVAFLDADDWLDARHLERLSEALTSDDGAVAAYCGSRRVMPDGRMTANSSTEALAERPFETLTASCHIATSAILVSRDAVLEVGGFDPALRTCEEWDLFQRIARLGRRWIHVSEVLSYYRFSENSLSQDYWRLLSDTETVVRRGFTMDPRVARPAPEHLGGAAEIDGRTVDLALTEVALWYGAIDCVRGGDGSAALDLLARLPPPSIARARPFVRTLVYAAVYALVITPEEIVSRWPDFSPALRRLIDRLEQVWRDPVLSQEFLDQLECAVLECADLREPQLVGRTLGAPLGLHFTTTLTLPEGVDRLHLRFMRGPRRGEHIEFSASGTISRWHILRLFLEPYSETRASLIRPRTWPALLRRLVIGRRQFSRE